MNKVILLMGPTATGKTELALKLAESFSIEIINVDSVLVYKGMDIGTAKPTIAELNHVQHHLINIISPLESYSVAEFLQSALYLINDIIARGNTPVLVGGTMMYYNALINGISKLPESNPIIRTKLEQRIEQNGLNTLYNELCIVDEFAAKKINCNDKQRIMRALEVFYITGQPISSLQIKKSDTLKNTKLLSLCILPENREILHQRINERFSKMLDSGFLNEILTLRVKYPSLTDTHTSMRSVGYFQAWQYLENKVDEIQMIEMATAATRQLAKRQITWLRKFDAINIASNGFSLSDMYSELHKLVYSFISTKP